uniref:Uncharacterized protein n=1 Tax=Chrysotila carterae TaxID=13221 RepID=A0A7S4B126_CHRCT
MMAAMLINNTSDAQPKHVHFATEDTVFEIPIELADDSSIDGIKRPRKRRQAKGLKKGRRQHVPVILDWDIDLNTMRVSGAVYQKRTSNNRRVPPATPTETSPMNISITSRCSFYKAETQSGSTYVLGTPCKKLRHKVRMAEYFQALTRGYAARKQFRQLQAPRLAAALYIQAATRRRLAQRRFLEANAEVAAATAAAALIVCTPTQQHSKKRAHELGPAHLESSEKRQRTSEPPLLKWCLELKRRLFLPLCTANEKSLRSQLRSHSHSFGVLRAGLYL